MSSLVESFDSTLPASRRDSGANAGAVSTTTAGAVGALTDGATDGANEGATPVVIAEGLGLATGAEATGASFAGTGFFSSTSSALALAISPRLLTSERPRSALWYNFLVGFMVNSLLNLTALYQYLLDLHSRFLRPTRGTNRETTPSRLTIVSICFYCFYLNQVLT
jgi:hypothetical protein